MKIQQGQVAVITGAGGGIGRCLAKALAAKGCNLALADINQIALEETRSEVANTGVKVSLHQVDITSAEAMQGFAEAVVAEHGKVNLLLNNAGITIQKSFETHSLKDWELMLGVNLWGVIYGCKYFLPALKEAGQKEGAHIINLSSMAAFIGFPNQSSYCAVKSAVQAMSESLWAELHDDNVGVTSIHPGCVKTDMIKATLNNSDNVEIARRNYEMANRVGVTPEYAAERILKAVEKKSIRIRIGKDSVALDLLKRLLPKGIIKPMAKVFRQSQIQEPAA